MGIVMSGMSAMELVANYHCGSRSIDEIALRAGHLWTGQWRNKTVFGNVEITIEMCLIPSIMNTDRDILTPTTSQEAIVQLTIYNYSIQLTAEAATEPQMGPGEQRLTSHPHSNTTPSVTDIDGWLGKVTNKEVDWDYWHAIIDEYYYPADHHHHLSLPIPIPGCVSNSGDDDSDGASASDGGSASTTASDGEWPSTSIIREYLDSPPRDASFQKRCIETGDRRDDWCFDDIGEPSGGLG
ncbi:hypothetical protein BDBG_08662 [Blastomyces gilchristii SLH14081]|uniref:Uncharacterized protein n=1 Tax=Blastomyces gilchristii (strain SLH14081) TaxID=559298 RepID=A0A179V1Y4_BLAGS|nr:uncharacterized protein BDBG_08662 [Blastomyces gilchristii SLH14081]OAT13469.1 hypothetical protein BDBG_08662 [Blastomyces gilchristii SLH14081]